MGRPKLMHDARPCSFYLRAHHQAAIIEAARRGGYKSGSRALREILDQAALAYGVPIPDEREEQGHV